MFASARRLRALNVPLALALVASVLFGALSSEAQAQTPGPLHTAGSTFLDAQGNVVRLNGVNWFGLETNTYAPHGLWARNYADMLDQMVAAGFNTLRLPFSDQLFDAASVPSGIDYQKNPDLKGLNGVQIMDKIVSAAGARGLYVLLDRHRPTADRQSELWYTDRVPEERWIQDWVMLAKRYAGNPAVIGADLHNEPHGPATWGDGNPKTDWRLAAERAGNAILAVNPDWLIVVEGIEHYGNDWYWWGGNLAGVNDAPVRLSAPDKLVYSTHDYGPGVYWQRWFSAADFPANLAGIWRVHWAFLQQDGVAPVLVGEFGGRSVGSDAEGVWQRTLLAFLRDNGLSYTYWAWNPDSGDTGGLLADDWSTLDQRKLAMLSPKTAAQPAPPTEAQAAPPGDTLVSPPEDGQATQPADAAAQPGADQATQPADTLAYQPQGGQATQPADAAAQPGAQPGVVLGPQPVAIAPVPPMGNFAPGGPFDPDLAHALGGVGSLSDPDSTHRQARERDERLYLAEFGKPWQYAVYATTVPGP